MASKTISKYKKLVFDDFSNNSWLDENYSNKLYSDISYNVNFKTKTIKAGLGISEWKFPITRDTLDEQYNVDYSNINITKINTLLYFRQYFPNSQQTEDRVLLHASDGKLYCYQMYTYIKNFVWIYDLMFDSPPICLTYRFNDLDTIILSSKEKMVVWATNMLPYETENVPIITSMCNSNETLFCTVAGDASKVWYCIIGNPELIGSDSKYTGSISLDDERGYARKVLTFKENLYAFRDYGITRINYYTQSDIEVKHVYFSASQIIADTITVCGDIITFMTRDGIYSFNGVNVEKLVFGFEKLIDQNNFYTKCGCMQDKLYLALRLNFDDGKQILCETKDYRNNAIIVINLSDKSYEMIRGVDVSTMLVLKTSVMEKVLVTFNNDNESIIGEIDDSGKYFDNVLPKYYSTNNILKDDLEKIVIRKISLVSTAGVTVTINTDNGSSNFVCDKDGLNEFQTLIECKNFKAEFSSESEACDIKHFEVEYYKA